MANRLIDLYELEPPIDIESVTRQFADLEIAPWPYECDGLTVGLTSGIRPKVFIKRTSNEPRFRFTIAHELGHVILPWHIEEVACTPGSEPTSTGGQREREASTFASHLLIPDRFVSARCSPETPIPEMLTVIAKANVSAAASLIALVRNLPVGFAFEVDGRVFRSPGTVLPAPRYTLLNRSAWIERAAAHGRERFRSKSIKWFRFEEYAELAIPEDPRDVTQLLKDAIGAVTDMPSERDSLLRKVNGVIGYAVTKEDRTSYARIHATIKHRLRARPDLAELLAQPDFDLFLVKKARSLEVSSN